MKPYIKNSGVVAPMDRANIDTDMIIPKQFLKTVKRQGRCLGIRSLEL